jgi:hypothetical protein
VIDAGVQRVAFERERDRDDVGPAVTSDRREVRDT